MSSHPPYPETTVATARPKLRRTSHAPASVEGRQASRTQSISTEMWHALYAHHPDVLLVAAPNTCEQILPELAAAGRPPLCWCDGARPVLPNGTVGTLVLKEPAALTAMGQWALYGWMVSHRAVQIIAIADEGLYAQVRAGRFLPELYYALNVVVISG